MSRTQKLYCYVDETGQDTQGELYIVVAILTMQPSEVAEQLEAAEISSGKGKVKWRRGRHGKAEYLNSALSLNVHLQVYYQAFRGSELSYELATVQATANAIYAYCDSKGIDDYKAIVIIDGLHRSLQHHTAKLLRNLGIRTKNVRGERDETNAMIRLADAAAGMIRESYEGESHSKSLKEEFERSGRVEKLP